MELTIKFEVDGKIKVTQPDEENIIITVEKNTDSSLYKKADEIVDRLQGILNKHYKRVFPARGWKEPVVKLMKLDKVPYERIIQMINWYEKNIGKPYTPVIMSGKSLRDKFCWLENVSKIENNY